MDERELVGLVYRADWTRLSLSGTVRGASGSLLSIFGGTGIVWGHGGNGPMPHPPMFTPDLFEEDVALDIAPGQRFRMTTASGRWVGGCDGSRVWQWQPDLPEDPNAGFRAAPQPPLSQLLAPSWLLSGHTLTVEDDQVTACGRAGIRVSARSTAGERLAGGVRPGELPNVWRWELIGTYDRAVVVIDAELGILLRCELALTDRDPRVAEFVALTVGAEADPSVFTALPGSLLGDAATPGDLVGRSGREAAKMVAGLAAGGIGAMVKYGPRRRVDPFERATAEDADPDAAMPAGEPLPGWAAGGPDSDRVPVGDEVLHLLYRGGVELTPFTATLHEWVGATGLLGAVPESARRVGLGGVGFLVDALQERGEEADPTMHTVSQVRFAGWDQFREDRMPPAPETRQGRPSRESRTPVTVVCDGSRCWKVYQDRVEVGQASSRANPVAELADGSWLLGCLLGFGGEVAADGRPGYLVIATARPGSAPVGALGWLAGGWLPAVAVVDAVSGRLLRLTRYLGGQPVKRLELRSLSDGGSGDGSDDFGYTPPDGLRVVDRTYEAFERMSDEDDGPVFAGPDGWQRTMPDPVRDAVDAFKVQLDEKVAAARGFLGSFFGGRG
jgi:hypothetical protein